MATLSANSFKPQGGELRHGFQVAGLRLVPAARVLTEVIAQADVFAVPKASTALVGVMNLRGTIVPLFDPFLLGKPQSHIAPSKRHALVFDREEQSLGLLLDTDPELMSLVPAVGQHTKPVSVLADYLIRPWMRSDQPQQLWWELNHRAAFEFLARTQPIFAQPALTPLFAHHSEVTL
jgi:chemotaxis signal transduction protein